MEIYIDELIPETPNELENNFNYIETIGTGSFGTVVHAIEIISNRECAVKIISKNGKKASNIQKMKQEITILKKLKHKNIVEFFGYTETNSNLYLIMEYIPFGTLKSWLNHHKENINEEEASTIIEQILCAVQYLHSNEICHRDIKLENIMLSRNNDLSSLKLIDFGLSAALLNVFEDSEYCGTFLYMAPELIEKKIYSKSVDIWSIGIIMYMLLNRERHPYYNKGVRRKTYINNIKKPELKMHYKCSESSKTLLKKLLEVNPSWRYSADKALRHPWITRCINDKIPETFEETLKRKSVLIKEKELVYICIFMNYCSKKYNVNKLYKVKEKYINKIKEITDIKKEIIRKQREMSLEIISNESNNITNKENKFYIRESIDKYEEKIETMDVNQKNKTKREIEKLKEKSTEGLVKKVLQNKNLNNQLTKKKTRKREFVLPYIYSPEKPFRLPNYEVGLNMFKGYKSSVFNTEKYHSELKKSISRQRIFQPTIIPKKNNYIPQNTISGKRKGIKNLFFVPLLLPEIKISRNYNSRNLGLLNKASSFN